jgi:hypothetical protein
MTSGDGLRPLAEGPEFSGQYWMVGYYIACSVVQDAAHDELLFSSRSQRSV